MRNTLPVPPAGTAHPLRRPGQPDLGTLAAELRAWLTSPPLRAPGGGTVGWVDTATGTGAFAYPEIGGYLLTWLAGLPDLSGPEAELGVRTAAWLRRRCASGRAAPERPGAHADAYCFDLAIISSGLQAFGARMSRADLVDAGVGLAVDLLDLRVDGTLPAVPRGANPPRTRVWSTTGRAHLVKTVQCLLGAAGHGVVEAAAAAAAVVAAGLADLRPDGRFVTAPMEGTTQLHPHLYGVEGLWIHTRATGDPRSAAALAAAAGWALGVCAAADEPPAGRTDTDVGAGVPAGRRQGDVTAQAARMAVLLDPDGGTAHRLLLRLAGMTIPCGTGRAVPYRPGAPVHANVWASLFAAQACAQAGNPASLDWRLLV